MDIKEKEHGIVDTFEKDGGLHYYVSVKTRDENGRIIYKHFDVDMEVYLYIKQLENYINNPEKSKLIQAYPERFKNQIVEVCDVSGFGKFYLQTC